MGDVELYSMLIFTGFISMCVHVCVSGIVWLAHIKVVQLYAYDDSFYTRPQESSAYPFRP